jgi:heat shock protein HslJ/uncharacterized protein YraI
MLQMITQHNHAKRILAFWLAFSILLGACSSPTPAPTATSEPTSVPTPIPSPEPVLASMSQAELVGETWQWVGLRETMPASQSLIPNSENYTLKFNEDGTVNIKADCNVAIGSYQLSGDQLSITLGPTTLAECGPDSSYNQFLTLIEQAAGVGTGYGNMVITLANDAGDMWFQRATTNPLTANLQPVAQADLVDITWQWVSLVETMPASQSMVANSENYNLVFRTDGTYSAKADCNQLMGSYELVGNQLKLEPGISTLAECGPDSSYDLYSSLLERVVSVGTNEGVLVLGLAEDAGIMNFQNAGPAPEPTMAMELPPGDPAVFLGKPNGTDTFSNANNWTLFDVDCFTSEITGGQYVMTAKGMNGKACWEVTWPTIQNFYIETLVENPETCDPQDRYGLLVRAPDNYRGYLFGLDCSGNYSLTVWDGEQTTTLVEPTAADAILKGPNAVNRLGIAASEENFYLYANGSYLNQVEDFTFLDAGKIGYFVRAASDQPFTVKFDDLKVWILNDTFYPPQAADPGLPTGDLPQPPSSSATVTANVNVNVRSGPGMQFKVIMVAMKDDVGQVLGISPDGQWYNVPTPEGVSSYETGWVSRNYVTLSNPGGGAIPTVTPPLLPGIVPVEPPTPGTPMGTTLERGAVRNGPGIEYPIYGLTTIGVQVSVVGKTEDGEWWAIKLPTSYTPDGMGWINKVYLKTENVGDVKVLTAPSVPPDARPTAPGGGQPSAKALETIHVRSGPSEQYPSYGKANAGTVMAITGISSDGKWWVILLPTEIAKDGRGWVQASMTQTSKVENNVIPVVPNP